MESVSPIRSLEDIRNCYRVAREHDREHGKGELSWELFLLVGLTTGLRISDLLRLRVSDVRGKKVIETVAQKTGKETHIAVNRRAYGDFMRLTKGMAPDQYLLFSRQRDFMTGERKPITRVRAYQIIREITEQAGVKGRIGCHTLRKTFGYHFYLKEKDIVTLQELLCHYNRDDTLRYIGIRQEQIDQKMRCFDVLAP